jgi:NDP-sugar pyrophosphorylase family protein
VLNADTLSDCDLTALLQSHRAASVLATLAVREDSQAHEWGAVRLNADSHIVQIKGDPPVPDPASAGFSADPHAPYMFAGLHVLEPAVFEAIPPGPGSIIDVYIELLRGGRPLGGYRMNGYWSDIGTPERYAAAEQDVSRGQLSLKEGGSIARVRQSQG